MKPHGICSIRPSILKRVKQCVCARSVDTQLFTLTQSLIRAIQTCGDTIGSTTVDCSRRHRNPSNLVSKCFFSNQAVSPPPSCNICYFKQWLPVTGHLINLTFQFSGIFSLTDFLGIKYPDVGQYHVF